MSETDWPFVLQEAERARVLAVDENRRSDGLSLFEQLAKGYPDDGMVYFKRAEAFELQDRKISRTALVRAFLALEKRFDSHTERTQIPWRQRLNAFNQRVPSRTLESAEQILFKRDQAVYKGAHVSSDEASTAFDTLLDFLRYALGKPPKR